MNNKTLKRVYCSTTNTRSHIYFAFSGTLFKKVSVVQLNKRDLKFFEIIYLSIFMIAEHLNIPNLKACSIYK